MDAFGLEEQITHNKVAYICKRNFDPALGRLTLFVTHDPNWSNDGDRLIIFNHVVDYAEEVDSDEDDGPYIESVIAAESSLVEGVYHFLIETEEREIRFTSTSYPEIFES